MSIRQLVASWKVARGARVWHLTEGGLDADRTLCGADIPGASPRPDLFKRDLIFTSVPAARPTDMCERCWPAPADAPSPTIAFAP